MDPPRSRYEPMTAAEPLRVYRSVTFLRLIGLIFSISAASKPDTFLGESVKNRASQAGPVEARQFKGRSLTEAHKDSQVRKVNRGRFEPAIHRRPTRYQAF